MVTTKRMPGNNCNYGTTIVRITDCDYYKVTGERLKAALLHWDEVTSEPQYWNNLF